MIPQQVEIKWHELAEEVLSGIKEWRLQHPKASLAEIEAAMDELFGRMRARVLQDVALASAAAEVTKAEGEERPRCAQCGAVLEGHGQDRRELSVQGNQTITLTRSYAVCPVCKNGLFPPR